MNYKGNDFIIQTYEDIIELSNDYIKRLNKNLNVFYRGQANCSWRIEPSIIRNRELSEYDIIQQASNKNKIDVSKLSIFEYVALMQHYGYPTRFLDLTTNLDIALYFACADEKNQYMDGELFFFTYTPRNATNKHVMIILELCLLQREISVEDFSKKLIEKYKEFYKYSRYIQELCMIIMSFLDHGFVVLPDEHDYKAMRVYNPRIERQSGAFFICGNKTKEPITDNTKRWKSHSGKNIILPNLNSIPSTLWHPDWAYSIIIPSSLKSLILLSLMEKGISKETLF